jgi:hypothetical protein
VAYEEAIKHHKKQRGKPPHDAKDHPKEALSDIVEDDECEYLDYVKSLNVGEGSHNLLEELCGDRVSEVKTRD